MANQFISLQEYADSLERIMQRSIVETMPDASAEERRGAKAKLMWMYWGVSGGFPPEAMSKKFEDSVKWRDDL